MKKVFLIVAVLLAGTSSFAQKNDTPKNVISEQIGVVVPIGVMEYENNQGPAYGLSYQRNFTPNFGLKTDINMYGFKYDMVVLNEALNEYLDLTGKYFANGEAKGSRCYNIGVGLVESLELGNSGFFIESYDELVVGVYKDPAVTIDNIVLESVGYLQIGGKFGLQLYKMFGGFGLGLSADYTIGTPHFIGGRVQYVTTQLKLVQKF
ncbi:MAG: hypothetical protein MJ198_10120 [Bacteroidales bacterium]|nr:hypothetical protein [Bacteroidales bacterium]